MRQRTIKTIVLACLASILLADYPYYEYQIPMLEMYSDANDMLFIEKTESPVYCSDSGGHWYYPKVEIKRLQSKEALDELIRHWPKFNFIEFSQLAKNWNPLVTPIIIEPNDIIVDPNTHPVYPYVFPFVWITRTGTKFHARNCFYANNAVPQPLDVALNMGLSPCSYCRPLD